MLHNEITIVVPCKNEENYIGFLLDDLATQYGIGDTKIVIADASTDGTRKVISDKKKELGLNIVLAEGGPVSEAKNNGAKEATTPYILFIDSDVRFFSDRMIYDSVRLIQERDLELVGAKVKCYDNDVLASLGFKAFNVINSVMKYTVPFAVGAFMLTRRDRFEELGGFPGKYVTSEDFFLSKMYSPKKFAIINHYFGQDSRRFKKMGYFGMAKYLIVNFLNRNNEEYWNNKDYSKYWD